jgi:hypothetical protein
MLFSSLDALKHSLIMKLLENGHFFQMCELVMGTQLCVGADVGAPCNSQTIVPNSKACKHDFLLSGAAE